MTQKGGQFRSWCGCLALGLVLAIGCGSTEEDDGRLTPFGGGNEDSGGGGGGDVAAGGTSGTAGADGGGGTGGSGGPPSVDGSLLQLELFADQGRLPFDAEPVVAQEQAEQYAETAASCYQEALCTDVSCGLLAACCIENAGCCSAESEQSLPTEIDFAACNGLSVTACATDTGSTAMAFGSGEPTITARGLIPGGDLSADGGTVLGEPVDLAARTLELEIQFGRPTGCGPSCVESVGVALTESVQSAFVDAELGLLLSGARDEVNLMIGGAVAESFAAQSDGTRWTLRASPDGTVTVDRNGLEVTGRPFDPERLRSARLVLFGRNLGEPANSATIASLQAELSVCDIPRAWESRAPITVFDGAEELPAERFGRQPSIETDGVETHIAYAIGGEIAWGVQRADAPEEFDLLEPGRALTPTQAHESGGIRDPELVWDGAQWHLFYTAEDDNGVQTIGHAVAGATDTTFVADPVPTLVEGNANIESPTVHFRDGLWIMVARVRDADDVTELRGYYSTELPGGWLPIVGGQLERVTRITDGTEELTAPTLIVHNSAYQLYYARRVGTRWAIELLASDEMLAWRSLGQVLAEGDAPFDSLGALAPDALSQGDAIELLYEGQDGVSFSLGLASRRAPAASVSDLL